MVRQDKSFRLRWIWSVVAILSLAIPAAAHPQTPALDPQAESRVDALLARMTLEEKVGQLHQLFYGIMPDAPNPEESVRKGKIGSFLFVTDPVVTNRLQHLAVDESRLHIPLLFGFDVIHGLRTIFPVPIAMAASWDPSLIERGQSIAALEASAVGVRWTFAPMVDIARDGRWGRMIEGAGEDPFLGSAVARAQVRGFQGSSPGMRDHVLACVKHFAGYGAADGGRDYDSSYIPEELLRNVYLPPFHAAVEAGSATLMSAYMDLNDVPATGNRFLLQEVLRQDWKFGGFVVSDAFAVKDLATHGFARDPKDAAFRAFTAGVDMDMGSGTYSDQLAALVDGDKISVSALDHSVRAILLAKMRLGLFEHPFVDEARSRQVLGRADHRMAARVAAQRSAVLLRNEGNLLPLKNAAGSYRSVAVIGVLGDSARDTLGSWSLAADPKDAVTVLQGIRGKLPEAVRVEYAPGVEMHRNIPSFFDALLHIPPEPEVTEAAAAKLFDDAVSLARRSDLVIAVLGEKENMSGEAASRASFALPGRQEELLRALSATGKPVVLVLLNGRPLDLLWASTHVPAILEAWYPGTEGGLAVADLLFGDAVPGGKLPVTWPRGVGQMPLYYAHNLTHQPETGEGFRSRYWDEVSLPLYPFGYGLSYTTFRYGDVEIGLPKVRIGEKQSVKVTVENTGARAGDEVVQLYLHQRAGTTSHPVRELKGFERVALAPHEKKTVQFTLGPQELSFWSAQERKWVQEAETFDVWVGGRFSGAGGVLIPGHEVTARHGRAAGEHRYIPCKQSAISFSGMAPSRITRQ